MIWIDNCLDAIRPGLSWKDAPVECVINKLFKRRLDLFLQKYIIGGNGLLGRVEHHAIRIEFQDRGFPAFAPGHPRGPTDIRIESRIANEIVAIVPSECMDVTQSASLAALDAT